MRVQEKRDAVTVAIITSVLIFGLVLAVGAAIMFLIDSLYGSRSGTATTDVWWLTLGWATAASLSYLWRHRHP